MKRDGCFMDYELKMKRASYHLWTFVTSKLISTFGAQVYAFAISLYILHLTGSATNFAVNLIFSILPRTIVSPFAGYMADNYSRKAIVIISQIVSTFAIAGLLTISLTIGLSLMAIYATTAILSVASTFSGVTFTSSISRLIDPDRIQRAMSLNQMSISLAAIGSPAIGGLLYGSVSMSTFLIIYMVASAIAVTLESTMNFNLFAKEGQKGAHERKEPIWQSMKAGLSYLKLQPVLMVLIWISLFVNFLFGAFEVGYSFILVEKLKMDPDHFGLTQGVFAVGMLLMSIYFSARKEVQYPLLVSKRAILSLGGVLASFSVPLFVPMAYYMMFAYYMSLMFIFGSILIVVNTPIQVMLQKTIDDEYKGRIFSIIETMAMALMPVGMLMFGFLYDVFPAEWVLLFSAAALIIIVLILARPSLIQKAHPELARPHYDAAKTESHL